MRFSFESGIASDPSVKLKALHDFNPNGDDEVAVSRGEEIQLSARGYNYGDGWVEVIKTNGQTGIIPQWAVG